MRYNELYWRFLQAGDDSYYLRGDLIGDFIRSLNATIVECNTALGGRRSNTEFHYQIAEDHGFTDIAPKAFCRANDFRDPLLSGSRTAYTVLLWRKAVL